MDRRTILWKTSMIAASGIFFLLLMVWVPTVFAVTRQQTSVLVHLAGSATVQETPTVDPTMAALTKAQLAQQVVQLQRQNDRSFSAWVWSNAASILAALIATVTTVVAAFIAFRQWLASQADARDKDRKDRETAQQKDLDDRKDERAKEAEDRFQKVVEGLGGDKEQARIEGVILLHTFLGSDYEQFYAQIFNLAVANLRLQQQSDSAKDKPPDALSQALIGVFTKSLKMVRELTPPTSENPTRYLILDAKEIRLDHANLRGADLGEVWMTGGSLRNAILQKADLSGAWLEDVDFTNADLTGADLRNSVLTGANPEKAALLEGTKMKGATDLKAEQIEACKKKGALFEEAAVDPNSAPVPN